MITVAANEDERETVALRHVAHKKDGLVAPTVGAVGILRPRQGRVVTHSARHGVQDVPHLLLQVVPVDEGLVGCRFGVPAEAAGILERPGPPILLTIKEARAHDRSSDGPRVKTFP